MGLQDTGLSPYTRGNLYHTLAHHNSPRSIPVHTGKPSIGFGIYPKKKVYPRTHGETVPLHTQHQ